jgi:hypothetical protein
VGLRVLPPRPFEDRPENRHTARGHLNVAAGIPSDKQSKGAVGS